MHGLNPHGYPFHFWKEYLRFQAIHTSFFHLTCKHEQLLIISYFPTFIISGVSLIQQRLLEMFKEASLSMKRRTRRASSAWAASSPSSASLSPSFSQSSSSLSSWNIVGCVTSFFGLGSFQLFPSCQGWQLAVWRSFLIIYSQPHLLKLTINARYNSKVFFIESWTFKIAFSVP